MKPIHRLVAAMFLMLPVVAYAEDASIQSVVQETLLSNPEVLARWRAYESSVSEMEAARGGYRPRGDVTLGAGIERRDDPILKKNYGRSSSSISLTQMLYDGFATRSEVGRLDHASKARLFELQDASESVGRDAALAYIDVLRYRRLVELAEENYVRHRAIFKQIEQRVQSSAGRQADLEQASGRLALAETNLLTETSNLHDVSARFQRLVGYAPPEVMVSDLSVANGLPGDPAEAVQEAEANNPQIKAAVENVRAANYALAGKDAPFRPRVDFRLRHDLGENINGVTGGHQQAVAELVLNYNFYNGGSDVARQKQFLSDRDQARDLRDKACRDVRQTTVISYNDVRRIQEQLRFLEEHQRATEKVRDAYRKQFEIGQRTLLDLLDTENELFDASRALVGAQHDLSAAYVRTQASMGKLLSALGVSRVAQEDAPLPADWAAGDESAQCPAEAPVLYVANKEALDQRADALVLEGVAEQKAVYEEAVKAASLSTEPQAEAKPIMAADSEVGASLQSWASAWRGLDHAAYVARYAPSFTPAKGGTHESWVAERKRVFSRARDVSLDISDIKVRVKDDTHASTTFRQAYSSRSYSDVVLKTLEWEKIDGQWLIISEVAYPIQ